MSRPRKPAPPPPPPPAPLPIGKSTSGAIRICEQCDSDYNLSQGYAYVTLHDRTSAWADMPALHAAGTKVLAYKNIIMAHDDWLMGGMLAGQCNPSWFLTRAGQRMTSKTWRGLAPDGGQNWLMDIGNPDYQDLWAQSVIAACKAHGYDGVHMDDANDGFSMGPHLRYGATDWRWPDKYPYSAQTWITFEGQGYSQSYDAAMESFLANVGPKLKAAGLIAMPNMKVMDFWTPHGQAKWQKWCAYCSGACDEYFSKGGETALDDKGIRHSYSNINNGWQTKCRLMELAELDGGKFLGVFTTTPDDKQSMHYALASWLMHWNGSSESALVYQPNPIGLDPWNAEWTLQLGKPLALKYALVAGEVYRRNFDYGYAVINTHPTQNLNGIPPLDAQIVLV